MTQEQLQHAAEVLLGTKALTGGDEPKFLPKVYVVNGKCYMYLNVARRAALGTEHPIEELGIEDAWQIHTHLPADCLKKDAVAWEFDTTGSTFDGCLFCDNRNILAGMVPNPVINAITREDNMTAVLDNEINRLFLGIRAQNICTRLQLKTYRDLLAFTRDGLFHMRNVGKMTICEFDAEMDRVGLYNYWKYNKPVK